MFIAMNRFRVKKGSEEAFEKVWLGRDSYLDGIPGFLEFHLLKGAEAEDHTLYSSHTVWQSKRAFEAWTKSKEFRAGHDCAANKKAGALYLRFVPIVSRRGGLITWQISFAAIRRPLSTVSGHPKAPLLCGVQHSGH